MAKPGILLVLAIGCMMMLMGCSEDSPMEFNHADGNDLASADDATFLLVDAKDPVGAESEPAFLLDGPGPFFFWALDLTEDQKDELKKIGESYRETVRQLEEQWRQADVPWEAVRAQRDSLHQVMHDEMVQLLTTEQQLVLQEIEAQLESGQYPSVVIERKVEFLTEELNLTPEQQGMIGNLLAEYGAMLVAARDTSQNPRDFHESMRSIMSDLDAQVTALLDDEQLKAYTALKEEHRPDREPGPPPGGPGDPGDRLPDGPDHP